MVGNKLTDSVLDIRIFVRRRSSITFYTEDIILRHTIVQSYNCMTIVNVLINSRVRALLRVNKRFRMLTFFFGLDDT